MTAWKTVLEDLRKAGADDIPAFIRESLKVIEGVPAAR
jgi:hypothetical protein